jgi:predicted regulator of Ras-like GTPase activity (Roadblock/LC7/MglB family)
MIGAIMFKEALKTAVESSGGYAGLLMDFEGIPVETYVASESPYDIEVVGAEVSVLVKQIQRTADMLQAGGTEEVSLRSEKMTTIVRVVSDRYFVAMTLSPTGNAGKARFALRLLAPQLVAELA